MHFTGPSIALLMEMGENLQRNSRVFPSISQTEQIDGTIRLSDKSSSYYSAGTPIIAIVDVANNSDK
jgi:hypothetical protein